MAEFDTAQLVESIRTRGQIPTAGDWTDTKLLDLATEELRSSIVPAVLSLREGYYDEEIDIPFVSTLPRYRIPYWAVGQKLGGAYYVPTGQQPVPLELLSEKRLVGLAMTDSRPLGYIIRGNVIVPYPAPGINAVGYIRLKYQARPSSLVLPAACLLGVETTSGMTAGLIAATTVLGVNSMFTTGQLVDVVQSTPGFETVQRSYGLNIVNGTNATLATYNMSVSTTIAQDIFLSNGEPAAGQPPTIVPTGKTCFPQCPTEFWYILAQTVAVKYLENQGFLDELGQARKELERLVLQAMPSVTPRGGEDVKRFKNNRYFPRG